MAAEEKGVEVTQGYRIVGWPTGMPGTITEFNNGKATVYWSDDTFRMHPMDPEAFWPQMAQHYPQCVEAITDGG